MKLFILGLLSLLATVKTYAQGITTHNMSWEIARVDNVNTGDFDRTGGQIISYGTDHVEWRDSNGLLKQSFAIREINGTWENIASAGSILYEAESGGKQSTLHFLRSANELRIRIIILDSNALPDVYELVIDKCTTL